MAKKSSPPKNKFFGFASLFVILLGLGVVLAAGGFTFAASQETHDPFCASCHTQPETSFVERSTASQPADLAAFHTTQETRCIDCHSGVGVTGRMQAELLGARNAFAWYTRTAVQPAQQTIPIDDANCLKCHQEVVQPGFTPTQTVAIEGERRRGGEEEGGPNHWHEDMARWQARVPTAGTCTSCHPGHSTSGTPETGFQDTQVTRQVCNDCHRTLGEGRGD
jgi:nitrate/TMAO reductase-like tetraheme cytochrome c subunit